MSAAKECQTTVHCLVPSSVEFGVFKMCLIGLAACLYLLCYEARQVAIVTAGGLFIHCNP